MTEQLLNAPNELQMPRALHAAFICSESSRLPSDEPPPKVPSEEAGSHKPAAQRLTLCPPGLTPGSKVPFSFDAQIP